MRLSNKLSSSIKQYKSSSTSTSQWYNDKSTYPLLCCVSFAAAITVSYGSYALNRQLTIRKAYISDTDIPVQKPHKLKQWCMIQHNKYYPQTQYDDNDSDDETKH